MRKGIYKAIREKKKELNETIMKFGVNSKETVNISKEVEELINEYYKESRIREFPEESSIPKYFHESYKALKTYTLENGVFPSIVEWNKYANRFGYLTNISLEYITMMDWEEIRRKIKVELNISII